MPTDRRAITRALLSVSDKTGVIELAQALAAQGIALVSTGGTRKALAEAGLEVTEVADLTGFPEMMDGRVKTLHPRVHGGLLAVRENPEHEAAMLAHDIRQIDLLVVNLYPFEATVAGGADFAACVENIDIGGPAMIRGAAKNHADVAVVVDPADYPAILAALEQGGTDLALRKRLAQKAYARHRRLRCGDLELARRRDRRERPEISRVWWHARRGAALRREPAPVGGLLRRRRAAAGGRHGAPDTGQGPLLQQRQRHRRRDRAGRRVFGGAGAGGGRSSSTPTRAAWRGDQASFRPTRRRCAAILSRPSAASSRSTVGSMPWRRARS